MVQNDNDRTEVGPRAVVCLRDGTTGKAGRRIGINT